LVRKTEIKISIVIPVYNSSAYIDATIESLLGWAKKIEYKTQIIFVDDASTDGTVEKIQGQKVSAQVELMLLVNSVNRGKGYSVKRGMLEADGSYKIYTDADIPFGVGGIEKILYYLDDKEFDLCVGNRRSKWSFYHQKMTGSRRVASAVFTSIVSRYIITGVDDTQCGLKGFRADVADYLFGRVVINRFAFDVEILYLSFKNEFDIKRIPVVYSGCGETTVGLSIDSARMLWDVVRIPFRYHFTRKYL